MEVIWRHAIQNFLFTNRVVRGDPRSGFVRGKRHLRRLCQCDRARGEPWIPGFELSWLAEDLRGAEFDLMED